MEAADSPRVLIVDDSDDIREVLRIVLEDSGYAVDEAANGKQALAHLHASPQPTVVLLDLWMPNMDGRQVLEAVAAHDTLATLHVYLLITAQDGRTLPLALANLLNRLQVPIVAKPFDVHKLLDAVQQASVRLLDAVQQASARLLNSQATNQPLR